MLGYLEWHFQCHLENKVGSLGSSCFIIRWLFIMCWALHQAILKHIPGFKAARNKQILLHTCFISERKEASQCYKAAGLQCDSGVTPGPKSLTTEPYCLPGHQRVKCTERLLETGGEKRPL